MRSDSSTMLDDITRIARQAGAAILRFYGGDANVVLKQDSSPLTAADTASHELIVERLQRSYASIPVISEESADSDASVLSSVSRYWLVDPLDGTKEFVKRTNEFTVNIALIEEGAPVLGVVFAPAIDLLYGAAVGQGAWISRQGNAAVQLNTRRPAPARKAVVASKDHAGPLVQTMVQRLNGAELTSMGSSLKFCLVAEGKADLYLRDLPTMEWDTAAAQCVVEAAGGAIFELSGQRLAYGKPGRRNGGIMTVGDPGFDWKPLLASDPAAPTSLG